MKIPKHVADIIKALREEGYKAYIVGGAVRDLILGYEPNDYDIATNARPKEVIRIFKSRGYIVVPKGIKYGVVSVVDPKNREETEIATFRKEFYPLDYRRRDVLVEYADTVEEDLSRRDFTINAMAMKENGEVIDPFNGLRDLREGVIRFVGIGDERIREDPLRMLRAVRFAAKLGFRLHPSVVDAIRRNAEKIAYISKERIGNEVLKAMKGRAPYLFPLLLLETGLYREVLPELKEMSLVRHDERGSHTGETVLEHTIEAMKRLRKVTSKPELMLACMLHDIGKPETVKRVGDKTLFIGHEKVGAEKSMKIILYRWRLPRTTAQYVKTIIKHHMLPIYLLNNGLPHKRIIAKLLLKLPPPVAKDLLLHAYADTGIKEFLKIAEELSRKEKEAKPLLTGRDIMSIYKLRPGPKIGEIKRKLYEIQIAKNIQSKEELIKHACLEKIICPPRKPVKKKIASQA